MSKELLSNASLSGFPKRSLASGADLFAAIWSIGSEESMPVTLGPNSLKKSSFSLFRSRPQASSVSFEAAPASGKVPFPEHLYTALGLLITLVVFGGYIGIKTHP